MTCNCIVDPDCKKHGSSPLWAKAVATVIVVVLVLLLVRLGVGAWRGILG